MYLRLGLLLFVVAFGSSFARAGCVGYVDFGPQACTGAGGCSDSWESIGCSFGCIQGSCNPTGNSTSCCGVRHDYAQITQIPPGALCNGTSCGAAVRKLRILAKQKLWGDLNLDAAMKRQLQQSWPSRLPRMLYVINRCTHEYDVVYELDIPAESKRGM
jgi:hypothetical protein